MPWEKTSFDQFLPKLLCCINDVVLSLFLEKISYHAAPKNFHDAKISLIMRCNTTTYTLTCALFLKKLWDSDMWYRICFKYCVPILSHFWQKLVCWELFEVSGSSHCPINLTGQWLLPKTLNSSQQTNFRQKWLKIGTQYSKHILYNIS